MTRVRASSFIPLFVVLLLGSASLPAAPFVAEAQTPRTVQTAGGEVAVVADRFEQVGPDNLLVATGNVEVTRGTARLLADRVEINRATGDATAVGRVIFYDGDDRLTGQRIDYNIKTGTGVVYQAKGHPAPYTRILAKALSAAGARSTRVRPAAFTQCREEPP